MFFVALLNQVLAISNSKFDYQCNRELDFDLILIPQFLLYVFVCQNIYGFEG